MRLCDERVSKRTRLKHSKWMAERVTLRPPSKNSEASSTLLPSLSWVAQGGVTGLALTVAHTASPTAVVLQSAPETIGVGLSWPFGPPSHLKTSTVLTAPPLVKEETTSRSPSMWLPAKYAAPEPLLGATQPTCPSCRNQMATFPSPAFEARSSPK